MEIYMMGNGLMELKMVEEFILRLIQKPYIVANGKMEKEMDMDFSNLVKLNFMKEPSKDLSNMVMV